MGRDLENMLKGIRICAVIEKKGGVKIVATLLDEEITGFGSTARGAFDNMIDNAAIVSGLKRFMKKEIDNGQEE